MKLIDRTGEHNHNYRGGLKKECVCGKEISKYSKMCQSCYHKKRKLEVKMDFNRDMKSLVRAYLSGDWRLKVLRRDRYVCQKCKNIKHGSLVVHHIERFSVIIDSEINRISNKISDINNRGELYNELINSDKINDINNGITLCDKCHDNIHKGKRRDRYEVRDSGYIYYGEVLDVYDGDTYTINFDLGFKISKIEKVRLYGVDTSEIRTRDNSEKKRGYAARNFVIRKILGKRLVIKTYREEKYGRYLVDIILPDGNDLSELLIKKGYAKLYFGGKR